ncbi:MAG: sulfite exporter TauE/SafE family protein [Pseudohongiella sp.]|nr:sulfite exporter TauE/SafE family protein [Pseudohongiella sp.]
MQSGEMTMADVALVLTVKGMHCEGCERAIEKAVGALAGVDTAQADYAQGLVTLRFNDAIVGRGAIEAVIRDAGYEPVPAQTAAMPLAFRWLLFVCLLILIGGIAFWGKSQMPGVMQQLNAELGYVVLFGIGFLTGFHCIGMCGSFVVSYADKATTTAEAAVSHFSYGVGKTLSYTAVGAGFGLLGSILTITPLMRGVAAILAGAFLFMFGLRMLNVVPHIGLLSWRLPASFVDSVNRQINLRQNPLMIGLLSGLLLGCGPLQAMYVLAAGTGSPGEGALLLFFFGLGTLPPLLGFGFFASFLSRKTIHEMIRVSGVLVIVMGLMMLDRGLLMSGSGLDSGSLLELLGG